MNQILPNGPIAYTKNYVNIKGVINTIMKKANLPKDRDAKSRVLYRLNGQDSRIAMVYRCLNRPCISFSIVSV